jgi:hypothetical protein
VTIEGNRIGSRYGVCKSANTGPFEDISIVDNEYSGSLKDFLYIAAGPKTSAPHSGIAIKDNKTR